MSVTITIPAERLAGWHRRWVERITPGLLAKAAAGALQVLVMRHLQKVARERHDTANRLGATPTGFWSGSAQAVRLHTHANDAEVSVTHPGIARAVRDVIIRPRRAKALTIPLRAEAYGRRPRELERLSGAALFRPKGTRVLATEEAGKLTPHVRPLRLRHTKARPHPPPRPKDHRRHPRPRRPQRSRNRGLPSRPLGRSVLRFPFSVRLKGAPQ